MRAFLAEKLTKELKLKVALNLLTAALLIAFTAEYGDEHLPLIEGLEQQSYDWRLAPETARKHREIVIVDIDRDTLRKFGNWPIDRSLFAELNKKLFGKYQAQVVAYALPFSHSGNSNLKLLDEIEERLAGGSGTGGLGSSLDFFTRDAIEEVREEYNHDRKVIDSMKDHPVVLGHVFDNTGRVEGALPPPVRFVDAKGEALPKNYLNLLTKRWVRHTGYSANLQEYLVAADRRAGHTHFHADRDGAVRSAPYFSRHAGGYYPSLALAVYQRLFKADSIAAHTTGGGLLNSLLGIGGAPGIDSIDVGRLTAPMDRRGNMYIRYLGPGGRNVNFDNTQEAVFRYVSFAEVVEEKLPLQHLNRKIVFVGSSSEQLRHLFPTPVNPALPGVEIAATQLANLMDGEVLRRNDSIASQETALLVLSAIVLALAFAAFGPLYSLLLLVAVLSGYLYLASYSWSANNEFWKVVPMTITSVGLFVFTTIIGFFIEWRANKHLQSTFGQYVPPEFAKKIGSAGAGINLEGEGRELSVLFSDVRNFTALSETMSPRELTLLMNQMLTGLTEVIHQYDGTVDKYIGDAIMAFWNAPLYDEEHAKKSVLAALGMQKSMRKLSDEFVKKGYQPMNLGVGICTGDASVGNMGSTLRMTYTAIGDTVNLASRTEGLTKYYRTPVLVTETTQEQCKDTIFFRAVDLVRVKGRQQPALLYEPIGERQLLSDRETAPLEDFEKMRLLYVEGNFSAAHEALEKYRGIAPHDELADLYAQRLEMLLKNPPSDWDGVLTHETK